MLRTYEAVIEPDGQVRLLERVRLRGRQRALVTVLEEHPEERNASAVLSESALSDWGREAEDAAWAHLQTPE